MEFNILQNVLYEITQKNNIDFNDYDKYSKYNYHKIDLLMLNYFYNYDNKLKNLLLSELNGECNNYLNYRIILNDLTRVFNQNNIKFILIKGMSLNSIYPFPVIRKFKDIDLIIDFAQISLAEEILKKEGYTQGYYFKNINKIESAKKNDIIFSKMYKHETVNMVKLLNGIPINIDLNFLFQWKGFENKQIPFNDLIKNSYLDRNLNCRILNKVFMFLHLCCHYYNETTRFVFSDYVLGEPTNELKLFRIIDIILLLSSMDNTEKTKILKYSEKYEIKNQIIYCLKTINAFSSFLIDDNLQKYCNDNNVIENDIDVYMTKSGKLKTWPINIYQRAFDFELKNNVIKNMDFIE